MLSDKIRVPINRGQLESLCKKYRIRKLALFGSVLRDDFCPDSDVDGLVEFAPDAHIGWEFIQMQDALSVLFGGHPVDLVTYKALNRHIRSAVLASAAQLDKLLSD